MIELGNYQIPELSLDEAIESVKLLEKNLMGKEAAKPDMAKALGQSANSGAFFVKLADLRRYGLIVGRGDKYQTTDLARKLAYEKDQVKYQLAVRDAILGVSFYKDLFDRFNGKTPDETQFEIALRGLTNEHPEQIDKQKDKLRKMYLQLTSKISNSNYEQNTDQKVEKDQKETVPAVKEKINEQGMLKLYYGDKGRLELEESVDNVELIRSFLENYKKKLGKERLDE